MTTSDLMILRLAIDGIEARVRKAYEETGAAIGSRLSETLDNARDNINNALQIVEALKATLKL